MTLLLLILVVENNSSLVIVFFELSMRKAIVVKALWRNTRLLEDKRYEMDVIFDKSADKIPKTRSFIWFLMFAKRSEKVQVQLNNYCHYFVGQKQNVCHFVGILLLAKPYTLSISEG